jgi:predicted  nucleic acid-binding Zn-ribbon protein
MAKCPHCGEVVAEGQETCFACGQKVRARVRRAKRPHNAAVFVFAGLLVVAVAVGIIIMNSGRARRARSEAVRQEQALRDEADRAAAQAKRDSTRAAVRNDAASMLVQEVNDIEARFDLVRKQVVRDQPSPEQAKVISQISRELTGLRQLIATMEGQSGPPADSLKDQLRDGQRRVRTLISALSRASKR